MSPARITYNPTMRSLLKIAVGIASTSRDVRGRVARWRTGTVRAIPLESLSELERGFAERMQNVVLTGHSHARRPFSLASRRQPGTCYEITSLEGRQAPVAVRRSQHLREWLCDATG